MEKQLSPTEHYIYNSLENRNKQQTNLVIENNNNIAKSIAKFCYSSIIFIFKDVITYPMCININILL